MIEGKKKEGANPQKDGKPQRKEGSETTRKFVPGYRRPRKAKKEEVEKKRSWEERPSDLRKGGAREKESY